MAYCVACGTPWPEGAMACPACGHQYGAAPPAPAASAGYGQPGHTQPGHTAPGYGPPPATMPYGPPPYPVHPVPGERPSQGVAIVALVLNIIIWPGLGSLIAGRQIGWAQGFLFLAGVILTLILIGIPLLVIAWIWGIMTGVELIKEAERPMPVAPPPHY